MAPSRWVALGGLLPYGLSAILDPLTPARAVLLGLLIEASVGLVEKNYGGRIDNCRRQNPAEHRNFSTLTL